jgi:hypothetical protein
MLSEGHIPYEIQQLGADAQLVQRYRGTELNNVVLETFLIHGRVLLDFYYARSEEWRRKDDVFAFQFIEGGERRWDELAPRSECSDLFGHELRELYNKISTSVGHLSLVRLDKAGWNCLVLLDGLTTLTERWQKNLTPESHAALVQRGDAPA